jgi:signal transduction histidine kinase
MGLGLTIAKKIVETWGKDVGAKRTVKGSTSLLPCDGESKPEYATLDKRNVSSFSS